MTWARGCVGALVLALAAIAAAPAHAHRAPAVRENNRYLKLTMMGNRVRLLYTFYVGEVPGAQLRPRIDSDGDGQISPAEADAYGEEVRATVVRSLAIELDGTPVPATFASVDVGMGTPVVNAGAFAVDLVAWLCIPEPTKRAEHTLTLRDTWQPPLPGETEVRVEESPGVRVTRSTLGGDDTLSQLRFRWTGRSDLLAAGLRVDVAVDPHQAIVDVAPECSGETTEFSGSNDGGRTARRTVLFAVIATVLVAAAAAGWWRHRRRRHHNAG